MRALRLELVLVLVLDLKLDLHLDLHWHLESISIPFSLETDHMLKYHFETQVWSAALTVDLGAAAESKGGKAA